MPKILEDLVRDQFHQNMAVLVKLNPPKDKISYSPYDTVTSDKFNEIIHYVLTTLDEKQFSRRITWPVVDFRGEAMFRREVIKYLNELNHIHKMKPALPTISIHHIHQPSKSDLFFHFMFLLTQFVLEKKLADMKKPGQIPSIFRPPVKNFTSAEANDMILNEIRSMFSLYKLEEAESLHMQNNIESLKEVDKNKTGSDVSLYEEFAIEAEKLNRIDDLSETICNLNKQMESASVLIKQKKDRASRASDVEKTMSSAENFMDNLTDTLSNCSQDSLNVFHYLEANLHHFDSIIKSLK